MSTRLTGLAETLRMLRASRNVSKEKLGREIGVSPNTIRLWEQGKQNPALGHLIALGNALNYPAWKIIKRIEKPSVADGVGEVAL